MVWWYDEGLTEILSFVLIVGLLAVVLFVIALVVPPMNGVEIELELELAAGAGCVGSEV